MAEILEVTQDPGGAILVRGELDLSTRWQLADAMARCVHDPIVIDLSGCAFLDSSALAVIVRTGQRIESDGRRLVIRNPSRPARRVIELSGVELTVVG